jgi:predicted ATPase
LLNPILSLALPDSADTASLSQQARLDQTRDLLLALLRQRFQAPARAILVENAQDLDPASWRLLLAISREIQPLLLVIATRPLAEPLPTGYAQLQQAARRQTLSLKALSSEETYLLACDHLGVVSLPAPLAGLLPQTGGSPFLIEELVYQLRDEGYLTIEAGQCRITDGADLRSFVLPTTAQSVFMSRIDRLSPPEQMTLKVASVIGRSFERQVLYNVHPVAADRGHLDRHLETLVRLDLIVHHAPRPAYTFRNLLTLETAYNSMLHSQRRFVHRQVAEWLERAFVADLAPHYASLARHWRQADEPEKAIHYLELASQRATQSGAYQEAERYLQESMEIDAQAGVLSTDYSGRAPTEAA